MVMRDIFGIAVAVIIAMLSLAFTAWTVQWWACLGIAAAVATGTGLHIIWPTLLRFVLWASERKGFVITAIACVVMLIVAGGAVWRSSSMSVDSPMIFPKIKYRQGRASPTPKPPDKQGRKTRL